MEPFPAGPGPDPIPPAPDPPPPPSPPPLLTGLTIAVAVVMFGLCALRSGSPDPKPETLWALGAPPAHEVWTGAWWALISSVFLHVGVLHLFFNAAWLADLGRPIEQLAGKAWFVGLFLGGAIVGSGLQLAASSDVGVGASGVVYALAAFVWMSRARASGFAEALTTRGMAILVLWLVGCWVMTALEVVRIGNAAHLGGLLFGLSLGQVFAGQRHRSLAAGAAALLVVAGCVPVLWMPWSASWWVTQGRVDMEGAPDRALSSFERALVLDPAEPMAHYCRALILEQLGRREEALADLSAYIERIPGWAGAHVKRAELLSALGRDTEALADYSRAIQLEASLEAHWGRATCRWATGDHEGALADYRACEPHTQDPEQRALLLRGEVHLLIELDRPAEALAAARQALRLKPDDLDSLSVLATTLRATGEEDEARALLQALARKQAVTVDELLTRGHAHLALGDRASAMADAKTALELDPRSSSALTRLALLSLSDGDTAGARANALAALELDSADGWACLLGALASVDSPGHQEAPLLERALDSSFRRYAAVWRAGLGGPPPQAELTSGKDWVAELVRFGCQQLDEAGLLAAADAGKCPGRVKQRRCEAHAFLGLFAERAGDTPRAREHYQAAVDTGVVEYLEYHWALLRLRTLAR